MTDSMPRRKSLHPRSVSAAVVLVIAALLLPLAVTASSLGAVLTSSDRFTQTFAPLAQDPEIQAMVTNAVTDSVAAQVRQLKPTEALDQYLADSRAPARVRQSVNSLSRYALLGIESAARDQVGRWVASDVFTSLWRQSLHGVHAGLTTALTTTAPRTFLRIDDEGAIWLRVSELNTAVRAELANSQPVIAGLIPQREVKDVLLTSDPSFAQARSLARALPWLLALPWLVIAILVLAGVLLSRARVSTALLTSAVAGGVVLVLSLGVVFWPIGMEGRTGYLVDAFAQPVRNAIGLWLLVTAVVLGVVAVMCAILKRRSTTPAG